MPGAGAAFGTDEHPSLEMRRDLHAGEREHGRREIDEADELVAARSPASPSTPSVFGQRIMSGTRRPES